MFAPYNYGPFGEVIKATGPMAKVNPVRFSTKFQDDETDLLYYGYRYYKASTGTWLRKDPVEERGGLNLYGFVKNDCINKYDSDGRIIVTLVDDSKSPCGGYHVNWDFTLANEASASGYFVQQIDFGLSVTDCNGKQLEKTNLTFWEALPIDAWSEDPAPNNGNNFTDQSYTKSRPNTKGHLTAKGTIKFF